MTTAPALVGIDAQAPAPVRPGPAAVREYRDADAAAWNAFVASHAEATFFHRSEWRTVLARAFGHPAHYLLAERDGAIVGILPLALVSSALFGRSLISTPFCVYGGPVATDEVALDALIDRACALARELGVDYLELRNRVRRRPEWPAKDLYVTFRREISPDSEKNMLAIPRKQRAVVRKGIQNQLRSEIDATPERLYALYSESLRNLGTPVFGRRYLEILLETFGADAEIQTILHGDTAVASVLSFVHRDEILPYYGGGSRAARAVGGNDFMYWEVMERARQRGLRTFDYGRSKRGTGSFDFKKNWGFEPEPLHYEYFLVRAKEMPNLSPTNPRYERMIRLWQRMPLWLTQTIGPPVAKYLG